MKTLYVVVLRFPNEGQHQPMEVYGPWDDADKAEQARRRIHFDARKRNTMPMHDIRTHVRIVRPESLSSVAVKP